MYQFGQCCGVLFAGLVSEQKSQVSQTREPASQRYGGTQLARQAIELQTTVIHLLVITITIIIMNVIWRLPLKAYRCHPLRSRDDVTLTHWRDGRGASWDVTLKRKDENCVLIHFLQVALDTIWSSTSKKHIHKIYYAIQTHHNQKLKQWK